MLDSAALEELFAMLDWGVSLPVQALTSSMEQQSENKAGWRKGSIR